MNAVSTTLSIINALPWSVIINPTPKVDVPVVQEQKDSFTLTQDKKYKEYQDLMDTFKTGDKIEDIEDFVDKLPRRPFNRTHESVAPAVTNLVFHVMFSGEVRVVCKAYVEQTRFYKDTVHQMAGPYDTFAYKFVKSKCAESKF